MFNFLRHHSITWSEMDKQSSGALAKFLLIHFCPELWNGTLSITGEHEEFKHSTRTNWLTANQNQLKCSSRIYQHKVNVDMLNFRSKVMEFIIKWKEINNSIESEGNSKTAQMRPGSLVKDKSLTHLLVKNASPLYRQSSLDSKIRVKLSMDRSIRQLILIFLSLETFLNLIS